MFFHPSFPIPVNDTIFNVAVLLIFYVLIIIFWSVVFWCRRSEGGRVKKGERNQRITISILIFTFLIFSRVVKSFFQLFSCSNFEGDDEIRLQSALDVICYSKYHLFWIVTVGLPTFVLLVILPGLAIRKVYLYKQQELLSSVESLETYGYVFVNTLTHFIYISLCYYNSLLLHL